MKGRRIRRKVKNIILKTITTLAFVGGMCALCGFEAGTEVDLLRQTAIVAGCWGWVILFSLANGLM